MIARLFFCLMLACALPALAQQPGLEVDVRRVDSDAGHMFEVAASGSVAASPATVWSILTDYEHMPEFVPDLLSTRVLSRSGNRVIVEQFGIAHFLFIRRDIHLIVQVREQAPSVIEIGLVTGDMKTYHCRWEFVALPEGGTRIVYSGKMVPAFYVPGLIGASLIRSDIRKMMAAVLARLERGGAAN